MLATLALGGAGFEYLVLALCGDGKLAGAVALVQLLVAALSGCGTAGRGADCERSRAAARHADADDACGAARSWIAAAACHGRVAGLVCRVALGLAAVRLADSFWRACRARWSACGSRGQAGARAGGRGTGAWLFLQPWRVDRLAAQAQGTRHSLHGRDAGAGSWQSCRCHGGRSRQMRESHGPANRPCPASGCAQHGRSGGAGLAQAARCR